MMLHEPTGDPVVGSNHAGVGHKGGGEREERKPDHVGVDEYWEVGCKSGGDCRLLGTRTGAQSNLLTL